MSEAIAQRFFKYVSIDPTTQCWNWTGGITGGGYGAFWFQGRTLAAHRFSYALDGKMLNPELVLDHLCRNTRCVNPAHLDQVTQRENTLRGDMIESQHRRKGKKTHCPHGHAFSPENTIVRKLGERVCRICKNYGSMLQKRVRRAALRSNKAISCK
jgi:hypothetical protein